MTRLSLCALAVALAAGQCLAIPTTVERAMHRFGDMEVYQDNGEADNNEEGTSTTTTTTTTTASTETTETTTQEQWLDSFLRAVQRQLMLQEQLLRQLMKDILDYFSNVIAGSVTEQGTAFNKVHEMMEMISTRMATAREAADDVAASSGTMESETLRNATRKFMKEVRVQDVVVDALWSSLRGVQTSAWMTGAVASEERGDTYSVANRAAEEFLTRMYHNLRAAGISEDDIVKFVPKAETETTEPGRNMGKRGYYGYGYGRSYGYYGGYGYPRSYGYYSYGYPSYYSYGYPSYYSYGYPSYYSYGYPSYYSYGYPSYYSYGYPYYYYRRLRPTPGTVPPVPSPMMGPAAPMLTPPTPTPTPTPAPTMTPPFASMAPFRSMFQEPLSMAETMMGQSFGPMDYPMEEMLEPMEPMMAPTPYDMPTNAYTPTRRNLAPFTDVAGIFPEPSPMMGPMQAMPPTPFGPEMPTPF